MPNKHNTSNKAYGIQQRASGRQIYSRSAVTNGSELLPTIDGRSIWARRLRDLIQLHTADLGGDDAVSQAERSLVRRAACLTVELERLELMFARRDGATHAELEVYQRSANTLRRLLSAVGLQRRPKDITPTLDQYLREREAAE